MHKKICIIIDQDLLMLIDKYSKIYGLSRSAFIVLATGKYFYNEINEITWRNNIYGQTLS